MPAGLGSSASEKYGTSCGSTSRSRTARCSGVEARSTYQAAGPRPASSIAPLTVSNVRPSFSTAAESVSASRRASSARGRVPGRIVSTSSRSTSGRPSAAAAALTDVTPGTTSVW